MDTLRERFYVQKTKRKPEELGNGEEYSRIVKDLYLDGYCNIKTYKRVDGFRSAKPTLSTTIEPKLEIQIQNPHSLEEAQSKGVSVLKAIVSAIHIATIPMDKELEQNDYSLITESTKFSQNKKVFYRLNHVESKTLPDLPDYINRHLRSRKLVGAIWYEAKRSNEICSYLHISPSTFQRTVKYLGNVIEKRGDRKSGYLYGVDVTSLYNNSQLSSVISTTSHSKHSLKRTALVLILFAAAVNTLISHHFI